MKKTVLILIFIFSIIGVGVLLSLYSNYSDKYYDEWTLSIYKSEGFSLKYEQDLVYNINNLYDLNSCVDLGLSTINQDLNDNLVSYVCKAGYIKNESGVFIWSKVCNHLGCRE